MRHRRLLPALEGVAAAAVWAAVAESHLWLLRLGSWLAVVAWAVAAEKLQAAVVGCTQLDIPLKEERMDEVWS